MQIDKEGIIHSKPHRKPEHLEKKREADRLRLKTKYASPEWKAIRKASRLKYWASEKGKIARKKTEQYRRGSKKPRKPRVFSESTEASRKRATLKYVRSKKGKASRRSCAVRRRAQKKNAVVGDLSTIKKWEIGYRSKKKVRCYWCLGLFSGLKCHTDHIVALSKGGAHEIGNLCVSCGSCNSKKHARAVTVWNEKITAPVLF